MAVVVVSGSKADFGRCDGVFCQTRPGSCIHGARAGTYHDVPLSLALYFAFIAGVVAFALVGLYLHLRGQARLSRLRRENRRLLDELYELRSLALDDLPKEEEISEPTLTGGIA